MATSGQSDTGISEPTFLDVLGENAPYIAALYLLNFVLMAVFLDYSALMAGKLTYEPLIDGAASAGVLTRAVAASLAGLFVIITLIGVVYAITLATEESREGIDDYDLRERISTIAIVPSMQLFAIILTPVLTGITIVDGIQFLIESLLALL